MNRTVAVGAVVVGTAVVGDADGLDGADDGDVVGDTVGVAVVGTAVVGDEVGFDGAEVVGAAVGSQSQRHWSPELHS